MVNKISIRTLVPYEQFRTVLKIKENHNESVSQLYTEAMNEFIENHSDRFEVVV